MNALSFWGKAQPLNPDRGPQWHPLPYHCLDVAAVGEVLLTRHRGLRQSLFGLLDLPIEETIPVVCFLLCLHDIGKFARKFQAKVPALYPDLFRRRSHPGPRWPYRAVRPSYRTGRAMAGVATQRGEHDCAACQWRSRAA